MDQKRILMTDDDFQKRAFELWMAVTMFMSTYAKESNGVVKSVSAMLPYATDLQNFWSAYQSAQSNSLIRNLHTKIRARVKLMKDLLEQSIRACGDSQKMLDKYSENQNYIERKLNDLYSMIPKEPRRVAEPEQMTLDFDGSRQERQPSPVAQQVDGDFLKCLNELRTAISGCLSSRKHDAPCSAMYMEDMEKTAKVVDSLWRRSLSESDELRGNLVALVKKNMDALEGQCAMQSEVSRSPRRTSARPVSSSRREPPVAAASVARPPSSTGSHMPGMPLISSATVRA